METLAERIARDGPVNELDAIGWAIRLAKRLESLHQLGVAHGSVSPACILTSGRDRNARAYLADLQHTSGNPAYRSPERTLGGDISVADDVWGLAATLYALLTGQSPFAGANDAEIHQKILAASPAPLAVFDIGDDDLQHILDRAFARDLPARTASVQAFRRSLEEWHPDRGVANLPPLEDEDATSDEEDDVARTVMVRDSGAYLQQKLAVPVAPAAMDDDDDDDDDNARTVMRAMPHGDLASMIAKAKVPNAPGAPPPASGPRSGPISSGRLPAPVAPPSRPGFPGAAAPPSRPGFPAPAAPPPRAGAPAPFPSRPGVPGPAPAPFPARPGAYGAAEHAFGAGAGASMPQPVFGARPGPPVAPAPLSPRAMPAPPPVVNDDDDDDDDDNARTVMRSPDQFMADLDAARSAPGPRAPAPAAGAPPIVAAPPAPTPVAPPPEAPMPPPPVAPAPAAPMAAWTASAPHDDEPVGAATMALPAFEAAAMLENLGAGPKASGGTQPMAAMNMAPLASGGTQPMPPGMSDALGAQPRPAGGLGDMAAPGDLSALDAPPPPPPGAAMQPAGPAQLAPQKSNKALLIVAALVALLIAAGVTFAILRSHAG